MKIRIMVVLLIAALLLSACGKKGEDIGSIPTENTGSLGGVQDSFGEDLGQLGVYDGRFEEPVRELVITCISGSAGCYRVEGNTITFSGISQDSVYAISGQFRGNIVIDVEDAYKFDLEMRGFSLISDSINPITILGGDEVSLTAKKDFQNYIYDERSAIDETDESLHSGAIHAEVDLEICGKGRLTLVSEKNNGIHTKDDLQVKNLTLTVVCHDNALKGNDSVTIENGTTTLISTNGDGIKTTNSDISEKGKQRGTVSITGGSHTIYAACDGIDAAYDVVISEDTTVLNIYTDKYSAYSSEITATDEAQNYIRFTYDNYCYSVKYYNSDSDYYWVDAQYHSAVSGGRMSYYYYAYPIITGYSNVQFFIYSSEQAQSQDAEYVACTDYLTINFAYDTFAIFARGNQLGFEWTNYTTTITDGPGGMGGPGGPGGMGGPGGPGGMGGMDGGNTDKGDHSTKGIKANNQIILEAGTISVISYDDAIHASSDNTLESGTSPLGSITINGGNLTVFSNDDGVHADGTLLIRGGNVRIENSYEGLEGSYVDMQNGNVTVFSSDDGINATTTSGIAVHISGGKLYIRSGGDGIDSNSRTSYAGIVFDGGKTVVISTSGGNSAIDTEQGYTYNGGSVLAIMPNGGMTNEATHCKNFASIATRKSLSLSEGSIVTVATDGNQAVAMKMPFGAQATVIYLGSHTATIATGSANGGLDGNGVYWS